MTIGVGTVLGTRWELVGYLATGGMADVYRGRDADSGELVAVKVLRAGVEEGERRFASEVATLQRLDHPHIVKILDAGQDDEAPWLVMELVDGPTLTQRLAHGALPPDRVHRMGAELAGAVARAHELGVVNRDIKPGNVLFDRDDTAKLADFGVALLVESSRITRTGIAIGTASFIAPEQLAPHEEVGPAADVYSLGLVLLESLTGTRAFTGTSNEVALGRLTRDPAIPDDLPQGWAPLLRRMTARDPAARPTAADVTAWLSDAEVTVPDATRVLPMATAQHTVPVGVATKGTAPVPPGGGAPWPPQTQGPRARRRLSRRLVGLAVLGMAVVALLVLALGQGSDTPDGDAVPDDVAESEDVTEPDAPDQPDDVAESEDVTEPDQPEDDAESGNSGRGDGDTGPPPDRGNGSDNPGVGDGPGRGN